MPEVDVGRIIKHARMDKKISQRELAKELGITPAALSAWETNRRFPPGLKLIKVAKMLDIVDELFDRSNPTKVEDEIRKLWGAVKKIEKKLESKN